MSESPDSEDMAPINMDNIGTMSLEDFKNLINSTLTVPNGTANSLGSSDSLQSENSSDDVRPYINGVCEKRPRGTLDNRMSSTMKQPTLINTKSIVHPKTGLKAPTKNATSVRAIQRPLTPTNAQKKNVQIVSRSSGQYSSTPATSYIAKSQVNPSNSGRPTTPSCLPRPTTPTVSRRSILQCSSSNSDRPTTPSFLRSPHVQSCHNKQDRAVTPTITRKNISHSAEGETVRSSTPQITSSSTVNPDFDLSTNAHANVFKSGSCRDSTTKSTVSALQNGVNGSVRTTTPSFTKDLTSNNELDQYRNNHNDTDKLVTRQNSSFTKPSMLTSKTNIDRSNPSTTPRSTNECTSESGFDLSTNSHANVFKSVSYQTDTVTSVEVSTPQTNVGSSDRPIVSSSTNSSSPVKNFDLSINSHANIFKSALYQNTSVTESTVTTSPPCQNVSGHQTAISSTNSHNEVLKSRPCQNKSFTRSIGPPEVSRSYKDVQRTTDRDDQTANDGTSRKLGHANTTSNIRERNDSSLNNDNCFIVSTFVKGVEIKEATERTIIHPDAEYNTDNEEDEEMKTFTQTPQPSVPERRPSTPSLIPRPGTPKLPTNKTIKRQPDVARKDRNQNKNPLKDGLKTVEDRHNTTRQKQNVHQSSAASDNSYSCKKVEHHSTNSNKFSNRGREANITNQTVNKKMSDTEKGTAQENRFNRNGLIKTGEVSNVACGVPTSSHKDNSSYSRPNNRCNNENINGTSGIEKRSIIKGNSFLTDHRNNNSINQNAFNGNVSAHNALDMTSSKEKHTVNRNILLRKHNTRKTSSHSESISQSKPSQEYNMSTDTTNNMSSLRDTYPDNVEGEKRTDTSASKVKNAYNRSRRMSDGNIRPVTNYSKKEDVTDFTVENNESGAKERLRSEKQPRTAWMENKLLGGDKKHLNVTHSKRRASVPYSVHIDDSDLQPRPITDLQSVLSLHMDGTDKIDTDNLEPPPADAEMFAKMELVFKKYKEMEKNSSHSDSNSAKSRTTSTNRDNIRTDSRRQRAPSPSPVYKQNNLRDSANTSSLKETKQNCVKDETRRKSTSELSSYHNNRTDGNTMSRKGMIKSKSLESKTNDIKPVNSTSTNVNTKTETNKLQRSISPSPLSQQNTKCDNFALLSENMYKQKKNKTKQQTLVDESIPRSNNSKDGKTNLKSRIPVPGMKRSKSLSCLLSDNQCVFSINETPLPVMTTSECPSEDISKSQLSKSKTNSIVQRSSRPEKMCNVPATHSPETSNIYNETTDNSLERQGRYRESTNSSIEVSARCVTSTNNSNEIRDRCKDSTNAALKVQDVCRPKTPIPKLATPLTTGRSTFRKSRSEEKENMLVRSVSMEFPKTMEAYTFDSDDLEYL